MSFFSSKYLFKNYENNTCSGEKVYLQTLFSHKVSIHFYSLAPMRNKCVYVLSVIFLVLLMKPSSHSTNHIVISLNFTPRTAFLGLRRGGNLKVLDRGSRVDGVTLYNQFFYGFPSLQTCVWSWSEIFTNLNINGSKFKGVPLKISCY
jgi:hypothetical protein